MAVDETYQAFIKKALIDPIRSVLIVDDDYPTIEELLARAIQDKPANDAKEEPLAPAKKKAWETSPDKVRAVINGLRNIPLMVDIHDGCDVEDGTDRVARHLNQSDLLILDYHLDETDSGDKAIQIARTVAANDHFNLVVVNTRYELTRAFAEMLLGLMAPQECFEDERRDLGLAAVEAAELEFPEAAQRIRSSIELKQYAEVRRVGAGALRTAIEGKGVFGAFKAALEEAKIQPQDRRNVLIWALAEFQEVNRGKMNTGELDCLEWRDSEPFWIRTDELFMSFADKTKEPEPLAVLVTALNSWAPPPSRLILSKFRAEMDAKGVAGESKAVGDSLATAHWYLTLLQADEDARDVLIEESIARHAEQLVDGIAERVRDFTGELAAEDRQVGAEGFAKRIAERFGTGEGDLDKVEAKFAANAVACSKPARGWHLRTGHVFKLDGSYWVCLTPICDMVPGQKSAGHRGEVGKRKPFIAVKLLEIKPQKYDRLDISTNNYLFLKIDGKVKVFSIFEGIEGDAQPLWYLLYAENLGRIQPGQPFRLSKLHDKDGALVVEQFEAELVAELRYEYAINLMQKLGGSLSRVGLDFAA